MAIIYVKTGATGNGSSGNHACGAADLSLKSDSPALDDGDSNLFSSLQNTLAFGLITFCVTFLGENSIAQAVTLNINAQSNIYGAGRTVPPSQIGGAGILPPVYNFLPASGQVLTFLSVTGSISFQVGAIPFNDADGVSSGSNFTFPSFNGISGIIDNRTRYLVGVFLDNSIPQNPAPAQLNFTGNNNFQEISPLIGQTFFVGDGLTGTGSGDIQKFNAPETATRLFLGFIDSNANGTLIGIYNDNGGSLTAEFEIRASNNQPVPEPSIILGIVTLGLGAVLSKKHNQDNSNDG
jgi:hypothetical protein